MQWVDYPFRQEKIVNWRWLDRETGLVFAEYPVGNGGAANTLALRIAENQWLWISPPSRPEHQRLYEDFSSIGHPTAFLCPNPFHTLGMQPALDAFPDADFYADRQAADRLKKKRLFSGRLQPLEDLQKRLPDHITLSLPPMKRPEVLTRVRLRDGWAWFVVDILTNLESLPENPLLRLLLKVLGFRAGPSVNRFGCKVVMGGGEEFRDWWLRELKECPPTLWLPGHGEVLDDEEWLKQLPQMFEKVL